MHIPFTKRTFENQTPLNTPDMYLVEASDHHLLFDYGPIMDIPLVCHAYTIRRMSLWNMRDRRIPALAMRVPEQPKNRIKGFLYLISANDLVKLDRRKQNGVYFERRRVDLLTPFQDEEGYPIKNEAWMYYGRPEYWAKEVDWDLNFYRGYGRFTPAKVFYNDHKQLMIGDHFLYEKPIKPPFKMSVAPHLRGWKEQENIRALDEQAAEDDKKNSWKTSIPSKPTKHILNVTSDTTETSGKQATVS